MATSRSKSRRILVGEDSSDIAYMMEHALVRAGYEVEVVEDGVACLERARETLPDLLILDIMMPKMHGVDVMKALRKDPTTEGVGVLVCSAKDFPAERERYRSLGAIGFLAKPFLVPELLDLVSAYFARRAPAQPLPEDAEPKTRPVGAPYTPSIDPTRPSFTLWGARGSIPTPGGRFLRHGGNTSCFSLSNGEECFVFDAGTGIRELGLKLVGGSIRKVHLFITHTHWDHIQGFPFFEPAYSESFELNIYGAEGFGKDIESLFQGQLDQDYFPVQLDAMKAKITFRHLPPDPIRLGQATISWEFVQHPGAAVGYAIEMEGQRIVWVPDNEFLLGYTGSPFDLDRSHRLVQPFESFIRFLEGTDLAVHEAQYTNTEYLQKVRWGHSSVSNACLLMKLAGVPRWLVTHHDPMHDDSFLEEKLRLTRHVLRELGHDGQVSHAYDGLTEGL